MDHQPLIHRRVRAIQGVDGINAVVLGGSRARSTYPHTSDIDLGIYYDPAVSIDLLTLQTIATRLDDQHRTDLKHPSAERTRPRGRGVGSSGLMRVNLVV